jgi:hypothetical protein
MRLRLVAAPLVLGVARAALAADPAAEPDLPPAIVAPPPAPDAPPPAIVAPPPAPNVAPPAIVAPPPAPSVAAPAIVVQPLAPAPPPAPGSGGPLIAGALTMFVPFVVGCSLWATQDRGLQRAGTTMMVTGFAAAPWVSHGLQRRWKRAAIFGGLSAATSAATLVAMAVKDPFDQAILNRQRVAFGVLLTSAMFAAALGVFDSFLTAPTREAP